LPGTTDLFYGRLARANRFAAIQYSLQPQFIPLAGRQENSALLARIRDAQLSLRSRDIINP
jgi:hypothetical protein